MAAHPISCSEPTERERRVARASHGGLCGSETVRRPPGAFHVFRYVKENGFPDTDARF